mgnify:FL=1
MKALSDIRVASLLALALLIAGGFALPDWALFLMTIGLAKALVSLGIVVQMRAGLVSFGQGLFFCS